MIKELWKPLEWTVNSKGEPMAMCPSHYYTIIQVSGKYIVKRIRYQDSHRDDCTGFASIDDARKFAQDDYEAKMAKWIKPNNKWVSVEDKLPDECGHYLTFNGYHYAIQTWNENGWLRLYDAKSITHWQKLPEPPEGGQNV